jgi:ubiquitin C-terminal hydrolase
VVEYLFNGQAESTLKCLECQAEKKRVEDFSIVSLPIPEPEFMTISATLDPIYTTSVKRVILKVDYDSPIVPIL